MKKEFKHIIIQDFSTDGLTTQFRITNKHDGYHLGEIYMYKQWNKYVIESSNNTIYDLSCLEDIIKFMKSIEV